MSRQFKIFIIFALLLLVIIVSKFVQEYYDINKLKNMIVKEETKSLTAFMLAFRKTYQEAFVQNHIPIDNKTLELLPVRTTKTIGDKFSEMLGNKTTIKTVSDRPRNPLNLANFEEMELINYFYENPKEKSYFIRKDNATYYYAQPLYIKKGCLKCHGKREDTIPTIRDRYDTAYDYKVGDLRGIISIKISKVDIVNKIDKNYYISIQVAAIIYILFLLAIYLMIKLITKNEHEYTKTLEDKVNKQLDEIRSKEQALIQQSKMASMGEMIGNIAHQWRQPLSVISTIATGMLVKKELHIQTSEEKDIKSLEQINNTIQHLSATINNFRDFFKPNKEKVLFNLKDIYLKTLALVDSSFKSSSIQIVENVTDVELNNLDNEIMQVIMNLLNNAKDALITKEDQKRIIFIDIYQDDTNAIFSIKDNGGGVPNDIIDKIFEPYFTTKHQSQGTGIGLYMSEEIITKHVQGTLNVKNTTYKYENKEYTGACFKIILPLNNKGEKSID